MAVLLVLGLAVFVLDAAQRADYGWPDVGKYIFDRRISQAAWVTLWLTIYSMIGAIVIGLLLAIMRLSPNPVLKSMAWLYIWIFRGTPVYVQLVFWGIVSLIYPVFTLGIPFMTPWITIPNAVFTNPSPPAVIGLALNEAAYMAEIVRGRPASPSTRARARPPSRWACPGRRRCGSVVLPQAMRLIIPPTGNEVISMLKTTSLVTAVPLLRADTSVPRISAVTFHPVPLLIVASLWYLALHLGADGRPGLRGEALLPRGTGRADGQEPGSGPASRLWSPAAAAPAGTRLDGERMTDAPMVRPIGSTRASAPSRCCAGSTSTVQPGEVTC